MSERCPSCLSAEYSRERRIDGDNVCSHCGNRWKPGQAGMVDLVDKLASKLNGCDCATHRQARREELEQALELAELELKPKLRPKPKVADTRLQLVDDGRGYGKTRAAARAIASHAAQNPHARIALVATNIRDARRMALAVMAESKSATYRSNYCGIEWSNGATAQLYSTQEPEQLRGTEHSLAWAHRARQEDFRALAITLRCEPGLIVDTSELDQLEF